jgi:hypothetical protein
VAPHSLKKMSSSKVVGEQRFSYEGAAPIHLTRPLALLFVPVPCCRLISQNTGREPLISVFPERLSHLRNITEEKNLHRKMPCVERAKRAPTLTLRSPSMKKTHLLYRKIS